MIHLVFCVRRLPTLTPVEFSEHWRDVHGPLVRRHAVALGIRRYEQSHPVPSSAGEAMAARRGAPTAYDGLASLWFDDEDALAAAGATPQGRAAAREVLTDEQQFIDLTASPLWIATDLSVL